ncbi:hypothetical protein E4U55_006686 [Claviceps digitariae]|nr:hypothetical protein E4U55_006686 [Claviceps digitariae]
MSQTLSPRPTRTRYQLVSATHHLGSLPFSKRSLNDCGETQHSCLDVRRPDSCCDNASYCYVNAQNEARCCPIGSNCIADSPCSSQAYYCTVTLTTAFPYPRPSVSVTTEQGCCGRKCPQTSYFLCPPDLGGKCCPYGSQCQAGGNCLQRKTASSSAASTSTSTVSASVCSSSPTLSATNGAISCPDSVTDGTDDDSSDSSDESDHPAPLSAGIKAGIGICISVTLLVVLGAAWFYLQRQMRRRKRRKGDISNRAELIGSALPDLSRHPDPHAQQQQASSSPSPAHTAAGLASEADDGLPHSPHDHTVPVEIASVEAVSVSPVSHERSYPNWPSLQAECPGGVCELEGSPVRTPEQRLPSPLTPPAPPSRLAVSPTSNYPLGKKQIL